MKTEEKTADQILTSQRPIVLGYFVRINKIRDIQIIPEAYSTINMDKCLSEDERKYLLFFVRNRRAVLEF